MDVIAIWTVTIGVWAADLPALELRALAKQVALPAGAAEKWDAIGNYTIIEAKATTTVKLYYSDSDSIADKQRRRGNVGVGSSYPNFFSIHAIYRVSRGPWKYEKLFGGARVGFWKVVEVKPEAVTIQVRSKHIIFSNNPIQLTHEQLKEIYEPMPLRLTMKDGVPLLK